MLAVWGLLTPGAVALPAVAQELFEVVIDGGRVIDPETCLDAVRTVDDGWQERLGISYNAVQWEATGERLTRETFDAHRATGEGTIIIHMIKEEWIELAMSTPFVMVASDGMPYAPGAHPRSADTFARVLGRYVRERGVLDLPDPQDDAHAGATGRGCISGNEAHRPDPGRGRRRCHDLRSTDDSRHRDLETGPAYSVGIHHVVGNGELVVSDGETLEGARPGRAVVGRYRDKPSPSQPAL
ncbi:MAG: hypothetical protein VYE73_13785 [Acidobacteriota bacterium]|nr:hypothetical protein [Acidobacteriota bacterium]